MKTTFKKTLIAAGVTALMGGLAGQAQAANWLMLQGTEPAGAAPRAKVWGFIQPEYQVTDDTKLKAGPWAGQSAVFNQIRPNLKSNSSINIIRARVGVRGTAMPLDSNVNYFFLAEFGNNGVTWPNGGFGNARITDASVTLNHIKGARIRVGLFKTPGSEEGLQAIHVFDYVNFTNVTNGLLLERYFAGDGSDTNSANAPIGPVGAFRDIGVQVFDTFKVKNWEHSYAVMIGNGNGSMPETDKNHDTYAYWSSELVFGGKGPRRQGMKVFAWYQTGKRTLTAAGAGTYDRTRSGLGLTYRKGKHRAAFEYITADGMIFNGSDGGAVPGSRNNANSATASWNVATTGKADGFYIHYGYAPTPSWEFDIRYDTYDRLTNSTTGERKFDTVTFGVQHFFNKKSRLIINYEYRDADAPGYSDTAPPNQILDSMSDRISAQILTVF